MLRKTLSLEMPSFLSWINHIYKGIGLDRKNHVYAKGDLETKPQRNYFMMTSHELPPDDVSEPSSKERANHSSRYEESSS